jgi:hypothetical protein
MILITGSGRSGTSAVAQMLHDAGMSVGRDLIEPDEHNAEGYFEERMLVMINDAILNAAGVGAPFSIASRTAILEASQEYLDHMVALASDATPAWKDPRLCLTLEAWLQVISRPRLIVCLRSPAEVASSTLRYYGQTGEDAEAAVMHVWRFGYERLLQIIDEYHLDAMTVEYDDLHAEPERAVQCLGAFVGRSLDASSIRRDLRHHAREIPPSMREMYERVRALGAGSLEAR